MNYFSVSEALPLSLSDRFRDYMEHLSALSPSVSSTHAVWGSDLSDDDVVERQRDGHWGVQPAHTQCPPQRTAKKMPGLMSDENGVLDCDEVMENPEPDSTMDSSVPSASSEMYDSLNPYSLFNLPRSVPMLYCRGADKNRSTYGIFNLKEHSRAPGKINGSNNSGAIRIDSNVHCSMESRFIGCPGSGDVLQLTPSFSGGSDLSMPSSSRNSSRRADVHAKSRILPPTSPATWTANDGGDSGAVPMEAELSGTSQPTCLLLPGPCKKKCTG